MWLRLTYCVFTFVYEESEDVILVLLLMTLKIFLSAVFGFDDKLRLSNSLISNCTKRFCVMKIRKYLTTYKKLTMVI